MLRAITGYFFGGAQKGGDPQEAVDCETQEVNDWLVVNMTDRPSIEVDLDDALNIDDEEDEILGAVSLLMQLGEHGSEGYFLQRNCSDDIDSLASSRSDESMTEVISSDESDSISLAGSDASMPDLISSDDKDSVASDRSDESMLEVISSDERDFVSPTKSEESFLEHSNCRESISADKFHRSFLDELSSSRSDESLLEDEDIPDERELSPFSTNCSVVDFLPNEIVESFQTEVSTLNFNSIFSAIDIQMRPHDKYVLDLLPFGKVDSGAKRTDRSIGCIRPFREGPFNGPVVACDPQLPTMPSAQQTANAFLRMMSERFARCMKERNTKSTKGHSLANVTCHPVYSKTYVNHRNPAIAPKTDLLQRIKELEPEQTAKEFAYNKHINRGQLNRQNKNYIYESSAKKNRRKNLQRNHSGANNNRKC